MFLFISLFTDVFAGRSLDEGGRRSGEAAAEEHATTVPFLLQGKERRPLRELRAQVNGWRDVLYPSQIGKLRCCRTVQ